MVALPVVLDEATVLICEGRPRCLPAMFWFGLQIALGAREAGTSRPPSGEVAQAPWY
jgi:hypothetical protein